MKELSLIFAVQKSTAFDWLTSNLVSKQKSHMLEIMFIYEKVERVADWRFNENFPHLLIY